MKHGKRPSKSQRIYLAQFGFKADDWLVSKNTSAELVIIHRHTNAMRIIKKGTGQDEKIY